MKNTDIIARLVFLAQEKKQFIASREGAKRVEKLAVQTKAQANKALSQSRSVINSTTSLLSKISGEETALRMFLSDDDKEHLRKSLESQHLWIEN